jgi:hypothetical protein
MDAYDELLELQERIAEWRANDVFDGDQGFQRMLEKERDLKEQLGYSTE